MKLLIVDDEPLIHVSIEYCLHAIHADDVVISHAYNGSEMLHQMSENVFDIALVDIRMPGISGLDAISQAKTLYPETFYYIMSGFSEFEYAREAIHLNVVEYLLKPLEPDTLAQVITHVRQEQNNHAHRVRDSFRSWLAGTLQHHDVNYLYSEKYYSAILLLTYDSNREENVFWTPDFILAYHDYILSFPCREGILLMLYSQNSNVIYEILSRIPQTDFPAGITAFVSSVCYVPDKLAAQMLRLLEISYARVFYGIGKRYDSAILPAVTASELSEAKQWIDLRDHLFQEEYARYISLASRLTAVLKEKPLPESSLKHLSRFVQTIIGKDDFLPLSPQQLEELLITTGNSFLQQSKSIDKIDIILDYIEEHYCEDISLASLAESFHLTPNYLSTLLKNRLGMKFTDHLTNLRMAKARELLLTSSQSIKEITQQIGYYSQSHFTKTFIEKEGCTPAEFRSKPKC